MQFVFTSVATIMFSENGLGSFVPSPFTRTRKMYVVAISSSLEVSVSTPVSSKRSPTSTTAVCHGVREKLSNVPSQVFNVGTPLKSAFARRGSWSLGHSEPFATKDEYSIHWTVNPAGAPLAAAPMTTPTFACPGGKLPSPGASYCALFATATGPMQRKMETMAKKR